MSWTNDNNMQKDRVFVFRHESIRRTLRINWELWSRAKSDTAGHSFSITKRHWEQLRQLHPHAYALYAITCIVCRPIIEASRLTFNDLHISRLNPRCVFCNIILRCYNDAGAVRPWCLITYGKKLDVQLCFTETAGGCRRDHVQLYSTEVKSRVNPFRLSRDINVDPRSRHALDVAKDWIDVCSQTHERCISRRTDFHPSRLVQLAEDVTQGVRLYTPTHPVEYAALSYCWGSTPQASTNTSNVASRFTHLDPSLLPKTLQDALFVADMLGLSYIWIDSLCIVQDDQSDWSNESSKMADVYSNAHVVLAAAYPEDCAQGFLSPYKLPLTVKTKTSANKPFEVHARRNNTHDCKLEEHRDRYAIFERGWCMQERLLARRILYFLPDEIHFECQEEKLCECDAVRVLHSKPTNIDVEINDYQSGIGATSSFRLLQAQTSTDALLPMHFGYSWASIVQNFSKLSLTYKEDALPALSGLAHGVLHLKPGKYLAGLWERDIAFQLGWRPHNRSWSQDSLSPEPSFSWVVSPNRVDFWSFSVRFSASSFVPVCTLESSDIRLATANPYGQVLAGSNIRLRGHFALGRQVTLAGQQSTVWIDNSPGFSTRPELSISDWGSKIVFGLYEWEQQEQGMGSPLRFINCLLLQQRGVGNEYVRIGVIDKVPVSLFNQVAREGSFTII